MNRIKELRNQKGLTLKELSKEIGLRDSTISQYETGKVVPRIAYAQKLADFFNVSINYLLGMESSSDDDKKHNSSMDLADALDKHEYMTYQGKPIDDEDLKLIKEILRKQDK